MKKTNELKNALVEMFENKVWNKLTLIDGDYYIYVSAKNEFRKLVHQPSGDIAALVGCMAFGRFVWLG